VPPSALETAATAFIIESSLRSDNSIDTSGTASLPFGSRFVSDFSSEVV
jgi:hypothetical protein